MICASCHEPIDEVRDVICQRSLAWERRRKGGGTNAVRAAIRFDQFAHDRCVDEIDRGHRPQPEEPQQWRQLAMFDEF